MPRTPTMKTRTRIVVAGLAALAPLVPGDVALAAETSAAPGTIVNVANALPAEWQVFIVATGTQLNYQDAQGNPEGSPTSDVKSPIRVGSGQSVSMVGAPDRCTRLATTVIYVQAPGQEPVPYGASQDAGPGFCLTFVPYVLGQQAAPAGAGSSRGASRARLHPQLHIDGRAAQRHAS